MHAFVLGNGELLSPNPSLARLIRQTTRLRNGVQGHVTRTQRFRSSQQDEYCDDSRNHFGHLGLHRNYPAHSDPVFDVEVAEQRNHPDLSHPDSCMLLFVLDLSLPVSTESFDRPTTGDRPHQDDTVGMAQRMIERLRVRHSANLVVHRDGLFI